MQVNIVTLDRTSWRQSSMSTRLKQVSLDHTILHNPAKFFAKQINHIRIISTQHLLVVTKHNKEQQGNSTKSSKLRRRICVLLKKLRDVIKFLPLCGSFCGSTSWKTPWISWGTLDTGEASPRCGSSCGCSTRTRCWSPFRRPCKRAAFHLEQKTLLEIFEGFTQSRSSSRSNNVLN